MRSLHIYINIWIYNCIQLSRCNYIFEYKYTYTSQFTHIKIPRFAFYHFISNLACIANILYIFSFITVRFYTVKSIREKTSRSFYIHDIHYFFPTWFNPKLLKGLGFVCLFVATCSRGQPLPHRHNKALYVASSSPGAQSFPAALGRVVT